jgi:hypothetical protein
MFIAIRSIACDAAREKIGRHTVLPERRLAFVCRGRKRNRVLHKGAVLAQLCAGERVREGFVPLMREELAVDVGTTSYRFHVA